MSLQSNAILTILGSGSSPGVPIPACNCKVCTSGNPKNWRNRASAWLNFENSYSLLIDAGPDLRQQALAFGIKKVDAVLFTHQHADHTLGIEDLRAFNFIQKDPIPCYANEVTMADIRRMFSYIIDPDPDYQGGMLAQLTLNTIQAFQPLELNNTTIVPFTLMHGPLPILGYKIGNFAYATDCNAIPDQTKELLAGIDHLVLDGLRYEPHRTHFTIGQAIEVAQELKIKNTYLIHMTHSVDYDEVQASLPDGIQLCYDGLKIPVRV